MPLTKYLTNDNVTTGIAIVAIVISVVSALEVIRARDEEGRYKIKPIGYILIFLSVISMAGFMYLRLFKPVEQPLEPLRLTYVDSVHKTVIDSVKHSSPRKNIEEDPVMDVVDDSTRFIDFVKNEVKLEIDYKCINNSIAYKVSDDFVIFNISSDTLSNLNNKGGESSNNLSYGNKGVFDRLNLVIPMDTPINPCYIFFKATYYNKQIKGKKQPPLRRLYQLNIKPHPESIKDLTLSSVFYQKDYSKAKSLLIKGGYW